MADELLDVLAFTALLHDIPYIIEAGAPTGEKNIPVCRSWITQKSIIDFVCRYHIQKDLDKLGIDEKRVIAELVSEAENMSLAKVIDNRGDVSPVKSIFSHLNGSGTGGSASETFFHANEFSDDVLLETKRAKKDLYFDPSYLVMSFLDELTGLFAQQSDAPSINSVYYLIKKYFWSVTLVHHGNDFCFSLFDHAKITSALACCLYLYLRETQKTVFVSRNINFIRGKMHDPTEPQFVFLKISFSHENYFTSPHEIVLRKSILLWAAHRLLTEFKLYESSIFHINHRYALILLPNLYRDTVINCMERINKTLFQYFRHSLLLATESMHLKGNDVYAHFSSRNNFAGLLFDELVPAPHKKLALTRNLSQDTYADFFGPQKVQDSGNDSPDLSVVHSPLWTTSMTGDSLNWGLFIPRTSGPATDTALPRFFTIEELSSLDNPGIVYLYTMQKGELRNTLAQKKIETGFLLDYCAFSESRPAGPYVTLKLILKNPVKSLHTYPDMSQIHSYLSMTEILLNRGLAKILRTQSDITVLSINNTEIIFSFNPDTIQSAFEKICEFVTKQFGSIPYIKVYLQFHTGSSHGHFIKYTINTDENLVFIYDSVLNFEKAKELFEKTGHVVHFMENYSSLEKEESIQFLKRMVRDNLQHNGEYTHAQQLYQEINSFYNPNLISRWILECITKES